MLLALTAAALTMTDVVQVWHVFALATALGIVNAFDVPTRQSFIMDMVGRDDLPTAIGLNSYMFNAARVAVVTPPRTYSAPARLTSARYSSVRFFSCGIAKSSPCPQ